MLQFSCEVYRIIDLKKSRIELLKKHQIQSIPLSSLVQNHRFLPRLAALKSCQGATRVRGSGYWYTHSNTRSGQHTNVTACNCVDWWDIPPSSFYSKTLSNNPNSLKYKRSSAFRFQFCKELVFIILHLRKDSLLHMNERKHIRWNRIGGFRLFTVGDRFPSYLPVMWCLVRKGFCFSPFANREKCIFDAFN